MPFGGVALIVAFVGFTVALLGFTVAFVGVVVPLLGFAVAFVQPQGTGCLALFDMRERGQRELMRILSGSHFLTASSAVVFASMGMSEAA